MKKILIVLLALGMSSSAYALELEDNLTATDLSANVLGKYAPNAARSQYALTTTNTNGSNIYFSGSTTTQIGSNACTGAEGACLEGELQTSYAGITALYASGSN